MTRQTSRYRDLLPGQQLKAQANAGRYMAELAETQPGYQPAPPADDNPAEWAARPEHLAPFTCPCGARFHVRRHLEAHTCR